MLGAQLIAKTLKQMGVKKVFLYPGGTIAPILNALIDEGVSWVCARNEQGAGYAAIGAAKVTGEPQVVMVTSGPGATNLLTPVADAYYDSVPLIVITGQVGTKDINHEKKIRQTGFQETDTVGIFKPVTKNALTLGFENISQTVSDAFRLTTDGRSGPVLLDIPMDVQRTDSTQSVASHLNATQPKNHLQIAASTYSDIQNLLAAAERPVILAGNGIYLSDAVTPFREFVNRLGVPVVASLPGVGVLPSDHSLSFSFLGHTGEYYANLAVYHADLLLVCGARLDLRQTGTEKADFVGNKTIVHIDIDQNELEHGRIKSHYNVHADLKDFFTGYLKTFANAEFKSHSAWIERIRNWKSEYDSSQFYREKELSSYDVIKAVDAFTKQNQVVVSSGVGTHQQLVARYFTFDFPRRKWLTSAGHGTMGFDLPSNMGAMMSVNNDVFGLVFVGDGSFQMNIQELATIKDFNLPIKIFVLDNQRLGIVSQFQNFNWQHDPSTGNKNNPSFSEIGKAYGLAGYDLRSKDEMQSCLKSVFKDRQPAVVHCHINVKEDVLPMLMAGQKLNQMYPFSK